MSAPDPYEAAVLADITKRLKRLRSIFDLAFLEGRGRSAGDIRRYYRVSEIIFRIFHSGQGAMHMALNYDGQFDREGYNGQARLVEQHLDGAKNVLELACGKGFNARYLAERHPDVAFSAVDLLPTHLKRARARTRHLPHLAFGVGDFHALEFDDDRFDVVFVVEALCHATDMRTALLQAARVLRPDGRMIVVDGWRVPAFEKCPHEVQTAARLVESAMAVGDPQRLDQWRDVAREAGFIVDSEADLTAAIMPNLQRLERIAGRFVKHPRLTRAAHRCLPPQTLMNIVAGYLMPAVVRGGGHTYRAIVLRAAA